MSAFGSSESHNCTPARARTGWNLASPQGRPWFQNRVGSIHPLHILLYLQGARAGWDTWPLVRWVTECGGGGHWNFVSFYLLPKAQERQEECLSVLCLLGACQASSSLGVCMQPHKDAVWKQITREQTEDMVPSAQGLEQQSPWQKTVCVSSLFPTFLYEPRRRRQEWQE